MSYDSDLVQDSRLDTTFLQNGITLHVYVHAEGRERQVRRKEFWQRQKRIGSGSFGHVYLQKCVKGTSKGLFRAVKILNKPVKINVSRDLHTELEALAKFSRERYSTWFVQSFGWYEDAESIFIAMEYCRDGDLQSYLSHGNYIHVHEAQQLARQIVEALDQMHQNSFVHRDLKPQNVLIKSLEPWWIVLADFGISRRINERREPLASRVGTHGFMAPELLGLLDNQNFLSTEQGLKACDIWSAGEIIVLLLTGQPTFATFQDLEVYCRTSRTGASCILDRLPINLSINEDGQDLVNEMMVLDPARRIAADKALKHPWIASQTPIRTETSMSESLVLSRAPSITSAASYLASNRWTTQDSDSENPSGLAISYIGLIRSLGSLPDAWIADLQKVGVTYPLPKTAIPRQFGVELQKTMRCMGTFASASGQFRFASNNRLLLHINVHGNMGLWKLDPPECKLILTIQSHVLSTRVLQADGQFAPNGELLLVVKQNGVVEFWNTSTLTLIRSTELRLAHGQPWTSRTQIAFSEQGSYCALFLAGSHERFPYHELEQSLRIWKCSTGEEVSSPLLWSLEIEDCVRLTISEVDDTITIHTLLGSSTYDIMGNTAIEQSTERLPSSDDFHETFGLIETYVYDEFALTTEVAALDATWDRPSDKCWVGSAWDMRQNEPDRQLWFALRGDIRHAISRDGRWIALMCQFSQVLVLIDVLDRSYRDLQFSEDVFWTQAEDKPETLLFFSPDSQCLGAQTWDQASTFVWDTNSGALVAELQRRPSRRRFYSGEQHVAVFSPNASLLALHDGRDTVEIWHIA